MVDEKTKTRIEKLIPDYAKLSFAGKDEKQQEPELAGLDKKDTIVWRQLESQAHLANEQLEANLDNFQNWIDTYQDLQEMVTVQKALNVINTFGKLLVSLDSERQFVLSILSSYLKEIELKKDEVSSWDERFRKLKDVPRGKDKVISRLIGDKDIRNLEIYKKWRAGRTPKILAEEYHITDRAVQIIVKRMKTNVEALEKAEKTTIFGPEKDKKPEEESVKKEVTKE